MVVDNATVLVSNTVVLAYCIIEICGLHDVTEQILTSINVGNLLPTFFVYIFVETKNNKCMQGNFNRYMTIEELYEWAVNARCEDYTIEIQYRDDGGEYYGTDCELMLEIDDKQKTVTL